MDTLTMPQKTKATPPRNLKARLACALAKALVSDLAHRLAGILTKPLTKAQKEALTDCVVVSMQNTLNKQPMTSSQRARLMRLIDNQKENPLRALMSILPPDQAESMIMDFEKDLLNALAKPVRRALKNLLGNLEKKKEFLMTVAMRQVKSIQDMLKRSDPKWRWVKAMVAKVLDFLQTIVTQAVVIAIAQMIVYCITGVIVPCPCTI